MSQWFKEQTRLFVVNVDAQDLIENFLISSIASVLVVRFFLKLTDYPQFSKGEFHIAHILWGGFLMMVALIIVFSFLNKEAKHLASIIGGIGFGMFIDELGKFITQDNDYFFQPTIGIIYVIFILLFLSIRMVKRSLHLSDKDYIINALEVIKEVVLYDLNVHEKNKALSLLAKTKSNMAIVSSLKNMLNAARISSRKDGNVIFKLRDWFHKQYLHIVEKRWFSKTVIIFFIILSLLQFLHAVFTFRSAESFSQVGLLFSSILSGIFVIIAALYLVRKKRLEAYEFLTRAVLVSILLTQFFLFLKEELSALTQLIFYIAIFIVLRYLISEETELQSSARQSIWASLGTFISEKLLRRK